MHIKWAIHAKQQWQWRQSWPQQVRSQPTKALPLHQHQSCKTLKSYRFHGSNHSWNPLKRRGTNDILLSHHSKAGWPPLSRKQKLCFSIQCLCHWSESPGASTFKPHKLHGKIMILMISRQENSPERSASVDHIVIKVRQQFQNLSRTSVCCALVTR